MRWKRYKEELIMVTMWRVCAQLWASGMNKPARLVFLRVVRVVGLIMRGVFVLESIPRCWYTNTIVSDGGNVVIFCSIFEV